MNTITFRRPTVEPLHRETWARPAIGAEADDFRITQQFDDLDSYWSTADPRKAAQKHRATDIGNARCGYPLVAMARSRVTRHQDNAIAFGAPNNALCARQDIGPGSGIVIDYWHVAGWLVADGALVEPGVPIASVGKTGLGQVCHCHITGRRNGVLFDPEPLLFGGSITLEEESMARPVTGLIQAVLGEGNNIRVVPGGDLQRKTDKAIFVDVLALAEETRPWRIVATDGSVTEGDLWFEIEAYAQRGYVATALLPNPKLTSQGEEVLPDEGEGLTAAEAAKRELAARDAGFVAGRDAAVAAGAAVQP